jgi:hypothetical protein
VSAGNYEPEAPFGARPPDRVLPQPVRCSHEAKMSKPIFVEASEGLWLNLALVQCANIDKTANMVKISFADGILPHPISSL